MMPWPNWPPPVTEFALELADQEAIRDCLTRYARATDRCDEALLTSVFWPDAVTEFEGFFTIGGLKNLEEG